MSRMGVTSPGLRRGHIFALGPARVVGRKRAAQGKVEFYVRSGNTSDPEANWSAMGRPIRSGRGRNDRLPSRAIRAMEGCFYGRR